MPGKLSLPDWIEHHYQMSTYGYSEYDEKPTIVIIDESDTDDL